MIFFCDIFTIILWRKKIHSVSRKEIHGSFAGSLGESGRKSTGCEKLSVGFRLQAPPGLDPRFLALPELDSGLLALPALDNGLVTPPGLNSGLLGPPGLDPGLSALAGLDSKILSAPGPGCGF